MNYRKIILFLALVTACAAAPCACLAQASLYARFRANNSRISAYEPTWMAPLCQTDTRLGQGVKFSVANLRAPGMNQIIYGDNHGISTIVGNRIQFDFDPPSYFRNHSATQPDGFGNSAVQVKYRIASGNAAHGNYAFTAVLAHSFASRAYQNGYFSSLYYPKLGYGHAFGRFSVQTMLDGQLPTAKIYAQGRAIDFNTTAQFHPNTRIWLDIENNATYLFSGPFDGATQNFITPAAFYAVRHNSWGPGHALLIFDTGMQIATSRFHYYNHNLITEMRIGF